MDYRLIDKQRLLNGPYRGNQLNEVMGDPFNQSTHVDFHMHTTESDGTDTPSEIVRKAKAAGLGAIAITDHESINGVEEGLAAGRANRMVVVPGIELSIDLAPQDVHIVGLGIDHKSDILLKTMQDMRSARIIRAKEMLKKLASIGLPLEYDDVLKFAEGTVTRLHVALAMVDKGYIKDKSDAFQKYIGEGDPCYVQRIKYDVKTIGNIIRKAGGIAILAHPGIYKIHGYDGVEEIMSKKHLDGIEAYYPLHSEEETKRFVAIAERYDLLCSGGSDYHGMNKDIELGEFVVEAGKIFDF